MKNRMDFLKGTPEEVGIQLQEIHDQSLETSKKWAQVLALDPLPETGLTPKEVIWSKNKSRLYHYVNYKGLSYRTPVLILYTFVNKPYILDLTPEMSLIRHLVDCGFDVYLLEWGNFEWEDRDLSLGEIIHDYIARAVRKVCQYTGYDQMTILGAAPGGTLGSIYAALFPYPEIKNLILLCSPFDFSKSNVTEVWLKAPGFDIDKVTDTLKLIPKEFLMNGFKLLKPVTSYIGTYTRLWQYLYENRDIENWKALNKWHSDNTNFPGLLYREWIKELYQENKLVKGKLVIKGQVVDLTDIKCPVLVIAGSNDHLVPPEQAKGILDCVSSNDTTYLEYPLGHVGLVFGDMAKNEVYPALSGWLAERS